MTRYTFTCEHFNYDGFTGTEGDVSVKHITEFRADDLTTMLENFESFLRGAGFHFDGMLDIVKPDEEFEETFSGEIYEQMDVMPHIVNSLMNPPSFNATRLTGQNAN